MYVRDVKGKKLTFTAPSTVWKNDLVIKDRETNTLWSHHSMKAIKGPLLGTELALYPHVMTTWGKWRRLHPDSLVIDKTDTWVDGPDPNPWKDYFGNNDLTGQIGEANSDTRLDGKTVVIAVRRGTASTAWPVERLQTQPVLNDHAGDTPVVVVYDASARTSAVFERTLEGRVLTFRPEIASTTPTAFDAFTDTQTGSRWRVLDGQAVEGPLAGRRLKLLPSVTGYWFAWAAHYPNTRVWGLDVSASSSASPSP